MAFGIMDAAANVYIPTYVRIGDALPRTHHGDGIIEFNFRNEGIVYQAQDTTQVWVFGAGFTVTQIGPSHVKVTRP